MIVKKIEDIITNEKETLVRTLLNIHLHNLLVEAPQSFEEMLNEVVAQYQALAVDIA